MILKYERHVYRAVAKQISLCLNLIGQKL